jgi:hypothetical protein
MYYSQEWTAQDKFVAETLEFKKDGTFLDIGCHHYKNISNTYYLENELHVRIAKSKPKGVSKNGVYKMFLNVESYQYFVKDYFGAAKYADRGTHTRIKSKEIKPVDFYEQEKTEFKF